MTDLERLEVVDWTRDSEEHCGGASADVNSALKIGIDTRRRLLLLTGEPGWDVLFGPLLGVPCGAPPPEGLPNRVRIYRYSEEDIRELETTWLPCSGPSRFWALSMRYEAASDRLLLGGVSAEDIWRSSDNLLQSPATPYSEDKGQVLVVRQASVVESGPEAYRLDTDWELDLRLAGCGRRKTWTDGDDAIERPWLWRHDNEILAYCWEARPYRYQSVMGAQGYLVRIPLGADGHPETAGDPVTDPVTGRLLNYRFRRLVTLPGDVYPEIDRAADTLLLTTSNAVSGNAVWVYDLAQERFVGVATGGFPDQPPGNVSVGFDAIRGRVHLLTASGILTIPVRQRPIPAGELHRVAVNREAVRDFTFSPSIAVDPGLGRLFVAVGGIPGPDHDKSRLERVVPWSYLVAEDHVPEASAEVPPDPDVNTVGEEIPGRTATNARGAAQGSGSHVVVTGGVTQVVANANPACRVSFAVGLGSDLDQNVISPDKTVFGECGGAVPISSGHREVFVGATNADSGSGTGAAAAAMPLQWPSADRATDSDLRLAGECGGSLTEKPDEWGRHDELGSGPLFDSSLDPNARYQTLIESVSPHRNLLWSQSRPYRDAVFGPGDPSRGQPPGQYRAACQRAHDQSSGAGAPDPRRGTTGDGGWAQSASCTDYGAGPADDAVRVATLTSAAVACDSTAPSATARAGAVDHSFVAGDGAPSIAVQASRSQVRLYRDPEFGQVTEVTATASGVVVGPLSVGEIRASAVVKAKGQEGTATAVLTREWCGLRLPGVFDAEGCLSLEDPDQRREVEAVLDAVGEAVPRLQLSIPPARIVATPGGYMAVITKDPDQRAGDQAVNNDASHTVSALQAIYYNDGANGLSRVVVQLAGVHAEARYGVTLLPQFSGFEGSFSPGTSTEGTPATRRVIPGTRRVPSAATVIEGEGFEELFSTSPLPENPVRRFLGFLPDALEDLWRLFVQHPLEFLLLFFVFSLLGTPAYLAYRRRTFVGVVAG